MLSSLSDPGRTFAVMPRQPRIHPNSRCYHVFNRGARRWPIFQTEHDRGKFLSLLAETVNRHGIEVHAFCLMGNHYHLVLRCPGGNLAEMMQYLGQMYVQQFNHRHDVDGPLFRSRFGSVAIESDEHLLTTVRYVARNPLDIKEITKLEDYRWSSHRSYLGLRQPPAWLSTGTVLFIAGGAESYRNFVEQPCPSDKRQPSKVVRQICRISDATPSTLTERGHSQVNEPRLLLTLAIAELTDKPLTSLVGSFGFTNAATVRSSLRRARNRLDSDVDFAMLWSRLAKMLD